MIRYFFFIIAGSLLVNLVLPEARAQELPTPPNTVALGDSLFIDRTEVANIHWQEFLHYIKRDSGDAYYYQLLPDTLVWAQRNLPHAQTSSLDLTYEYFNKAEYFSSPVVGISYEQAQTYARWRSAVVTALMNQPESLQQWGLQGKKVVVEYRLPTEEEWMQAAAGSLNPDKYPYGYKKYKKRASKRFDPEKAYAQLEAPKPTEKSFRKSLRKTKIPQFQVVAQLPAGIMLAPEFPSPIAAGPETKSGLLNTIGNVAEMTAGPGIAKGGSFMHTLEDSAIAARQQYYGPAPWLGVRYVATVRVEEAETTTHNGF
ncbi:MAG: formylglycine-generating enzyme family protein [Bacteroidetes bacterium]|nr:formylglycine-generating enzyme family protein [Bacteroidota bacterium]